MNYRFWPVVVSTFVLGLVPVSTRAIEAAELPSYAATYEIRLKQASASEGPPAAVGTLDSVFQETCDGWETKTRTALDLTFRDSSNYTNERYVESWEAKTGNDYTFSVRMYKNGETVESYKGRANLRKSAYRAYYEAVGDNGERIGNAIELPLPIGTMLPVEHTEELLARAESGTTMFRSVVLNGASTSGPRIFSIAIGERVGDSVLPSVLDDAPAEDEKSLLNTSAWRMSTAQYNLHAENETPDTELFLQLHESGIAELFDQRFDDFLLSAKIVYLRFLDPPECD